MRPGVYLSTVLTPAPSYALVDLASLKTRLNVTVTTYDPYFTLAIADASAAAAGYMNNPIVVETLSDRIWPWRDSWLGALVPRRGELQLKRWPVVATPSTAGIAPPVSPALSAAAGGALAARVYYVRLSYVTASGETAAGPESRLALAADTLATVAAPGADAKGLATGYNVYAATSSGAETLQTVTPIPVTASWAEPGGGLVPGAAMPNAVLAVETINGTPTPLAEGVDFLVDAALGRLVRLNALGDGSPIDWRGAPVSVIYAAGYASIPSDIADAVSDMVKARWYAQTRDPAIRAQNVEGVLQTQYWFGAGPDADDDLPPSIEGRLNRYRVPVIA